MSLQSFVPTPRFSEYQRAFEECYRLSRDDQGVLLAEAHTRQESVKLSVQNHRSVAQLFQTIGSDPENEVLIFTGTGRNFMMEVDPDGFALEAEDLAYWAYEYAYKDGRRNVASLINDLEIPTIGAMNGPGFHSELCLMCDITICTEDTVIFDPHFAGVGSVPGDGIQICFQELLGVKRAAYALLTGHPIDARKALELGLVNEVVPRDRLIPRAKEIAALIMRQHRTIRRLTSQVIRRPWRRRVADDLDGGFGMQMFGHLAKGRAVHAEVETDGHEADSYLGEFEKIRTRE